MKRLRPILLLNLLFLLSCTPQNSSKKEAWKKEILETEKAFSNLSQQEGIKKAFTTFAADDVVINRNDSLIFGTNGLQHFYQANLNSNQKTELSWKPEFVDVSASGDLGYTFGSYLYTVTDSGGQVKNYTGIFHTVWKKQADGSWRFVWD